MFCRTYYLQSYENIGNKLKTELFRPLKLIDVYLRLGSRLLYISIDLWVPYHYCLPVEYTYRSLNGTKSRKGEKNGVVVKDSDQIGQLSKLCLIDIFPVFHYFWGLSVALGTEKQCAVMSFPKEGEKKAVKRLLSSTNVS